MREPDWSEWPAAELAWVNAELKRMQRSLDEQAALHWRLWMGRIPRNLRTRR